MNNDVFRKKTNSSQNSIECSKKSKNDAAEAAKISSSRIETTTQGAKRPPRTLMAQSKSHRMLSKLSPTHHHLKFVCKLFLCHSPVSPACYSSYRCTISSPNRYHRPSTCTSPWHFGYYHCRCRGSQNNCRSQYQTGLRREFDIRYPNRTRQSR